MGITSKTAKVKLWAKNMQYLSEFGYIGNKGDIIDVNVEHLSYRCRSEIEVLCDICGEHKIVRYCDYYRSVKNTGSYVCQKCISEKASITNLKKYGYKSPSQNEVVKEKMKKTIMERFGVDNAMKSDEIKKKLCATNLKRHGVLYPSQSKEIRNKMNETYYKNGTQKASRQQMYLHSVLGGELNYPIKHYSADICLPEEKLVIEYDGSGHELNVKMGRITQEEHIQKEIMRFSILKREGYKQMRIISAYDKLPQDSMLFKILETTRKYFSTYPQHSWIEFNIDTSSLRSAEHKDGIYYNFGKLRIIKDSDLDTKEAISIEVA